MGRIESFMATEAYIPRCLTNKLNFIAMTIMIYLKSRLDEDE